MNLPKYRARLARANIQALDDDDNGFKIQIKGYQIER